MEKSKKYYLHCPECGVKIYSFAEWFKHGQKCPDCGAVGVNVIYYNEMKGMKELVNNPNFKPDSIWGYFDYLPLHDKKNIVSVGGEGVVPVNRWDFLERYAKEHHNINIKVYAHRHDHNRLTGTFKDLAGTVVGSLLKENNVDKYVVASTGNIGVAYSRYTALAGARLYAFIPETSLKIQEAEIGIYGQKLFRVKGDYHKAKMFAKEFSRKNNILLSAGNFDPMRIEAKKTMVYEWLRTMPEFPTVFMQAISGGSGPIGIAKACNELDGKGLFEKMPRFILPQPSNCAPMAEGWEKGKAKGFPKGWQFDYPVYENPFTEIHTLSTGNPTAYPGMAEIVKRSDGAIISVDETRAIDVSRLLAYEAMMKLGPAAAITVAGFFKSVQNGSIKDGDVVALNIGEGMQRSPEYLEKTIYSTQEVSSIEECQLSDRSEYSQKLWDAVQNIG